MLDIDMDIRTDEFGVRDGRELAKRCIYRARLFAAAYADGDWEIADKVFSGIVMEALVEIAEDGAANSGLPATINVANTPEGQKEAAFDKHADATRERTEELIARGAAFTTWFEDNYWK